MTASHAESRFHNIGNDGNRVRMVQQVLRDAAFGGLDNLQEHIRRAQGTFSFFANVLGFSVGFLVLRVFRSTEANSGAQQEGGHKAQDGSRISYFCRHVYFPREFRR
jgi:hypothetical protein